MGWVDDDGRHEGWAAPVVKDGRTSGTYKADGVLVRGITGNYSRDDLLLDYEYVPDKDVIGWRGQCECGWQGELINRDMSNPRHADGAIAPLEVEDEIHAEWKGHNNYARTLQAVKDAHWAVRSATAGLDAAVREAKANGSSWADIGTATHMSRQGAHERWGQAESQDPSWG